MEKFEKRPDLYPEQAPEPGTKEFEEAQKEAEVVDWLGSAKRILDLAIKEKDKVLLENVILNLVEDLDNFTSKRIKDADFAGAIKLIKSTQNLIAQYDFDIQKMIKLIKAKIAEENLAKLEELGGINYIEEQVKSLLIEVRNEEFNYKDISVIFKKVQELLGTGEYTIEDAIIHAAVLRLEVKFSGLTKTDHINIVLDKTGTVIGLSEEKSRIQLIQEALKKIGRE
jgi:DNA polymerase sigma